MKPFVSPDGTIGHLDAEVAGRLVAAATDLALVIDADGVIRDVASQSDDLLQDLHGAARWPGRRWVDTVTVESRPKIEALLRDAAAEAAPRWRQVNHPSASDEDLDVPVLYTAVQAGDDRIVAFGRDLRAVSALQQRLVDAQHAMERDYARLRHAETRYRLLFRTSSEAVLVVEALSLKIVEANGAAQELLGTDADRAVPAALLDAFDRASQPALQTMLDAARAARGGDEAEVRLAAEPHRDVIASASMFRQDSAAFFLVRLSPLPDEGDQRVPSRLTTTLLRVVENAPDGLVVTRPDGRIVTANAAFLDLAELATEEQVRDQLLDQWLGRPGVDLGVLNANLRQHGSVRLFATTIRGEHGARAKVEVSAVSVTSGDQPVFGYAIRDVGRRLGAEPAAVRELPRSVEQLTKLIGHTSLKDLVREATDVIERLCIEAALELTGDNRASAAEMLGLSRQSLYVKLRRYGLGDLASEDAN